MTIYHSTYAAYGVHVPREQYFTQHIQTEAEWLDVVIKNTPELKGQGLGHLSAGPYDRDELFLVLSPEGEDVEVVSELFRVLTDKEAAGRASKIKALAKAAGYDGLAEPGWLVVPDES